jgi:hypothetical protein
LPRRRRTQGSIEPQMSWRAGQAIQVRSCRTSSPGANQPSLRGLPAAGCVLVCSPVSPPRSHGKCRAGSWPRRLLRTGSRTGSSGRRHTSDDAIAAAIVVGDTRSVGVRSRRCAPSKTVVGDIYLAWMQRFVESRSRRIPQASSSACQPGSQSWAIECSIDLSCCRSGRCVCLPPLAQRRAEARAGCEV